MVMMRLAWRRARPRVKSCISQRSLHQMCLSGTGELVGTVAKPRSNVRFDIELLVNEMLTRPERTEGSGQT